MLMVTANEMLVILMDALIIVSYITQQLIH